MIGRQVWTYVLLLLFGGSLALLAGGLPEAQAQSGSRSLRGLSMGGGAAATRSPTGGLYTNPAHLAVGGSGSSFQLRFFDVRASAGGDLLQFDQYRRTFGAESGTLTDGEEARVLDQWFGGGRRTVGAYTEVVPLALAYRPPGKQWGIGLGLRARTLSEMELDRGLFDLFLVGADSSRTVPLNGRYRGYSTVDLTGTLTYSFTSIPLSVGVSPRLVFGTHYADGSLDSEVTIRDSVLTHQFDYVARAAGALSRDVYDTFNAFGTRPLQGVSPSIGGQVSGVGAGIDLGAVYEVQPGFFVSMSLTDLGGIQWNRDAQTVTPTRNEFRFEGVEMNIDRLQNEFDGDIGAYVKHQVDSLARAAYEDVDRDRSSFSVGLPTALHVNSTWSHNSFTLTGGATVGLNDRAAAVSAEPVVHLGGELRVGPVPLRAGVRLGGPQALTLAGGLGLHVGGYQFDVGVSATPNTSTLGQGGRYAVALSVATIQF